MHITPSKLAINFNDVEIYDTLDMNWDMNFWIENASPFIKAIASYEIAGMGEVHSLFDAEARGVP